MKNLLQLMCCCGLLLLMSNTALQAQRTCGTDAYLQERILNDTEFAKKFDQWTSMEKISEAEKQSINCNGNFTIIPIAVHYAGVIDCSNPTCLLQAAQAQIDVLNEDFSASNADLSLYDNLIGVCPTSYPASTKPNPGNGSCIQFCLATTNHPAGSGLSDGEPAITVGDHTWPSAGNTWAGYLNLFVSDAATAGQGGGTLGISALPGQANGDGFWTNYQFFGGPGFSCTSGATFNTGAPFDLGRTATHEAGHYFSVFHTFQGGCGDQDNGGTPGPIQIQDTPPQSTPAGGCPTVTSCANAPNGGCGQPSSFYSFMDYSDDDCLIMFTEDQSQVINYWGTNANRAQFAAQGIQQFATDKCTAALTATSATVCGAPPAPVCGQYDANTQNGPYLVFAQGDEIPCNGNTLTAGFAAWTNEAYAFDAVAGGNYTYDFCDGFDPNATGWNGCAIITVGYDTNGDGVITDEAAGDILASNESSGGGCSITFATPTAGSVIIVINDCTCSGTTVQTNNGTPSITTNAGIPCPMGTCPTFAAAQINTTEVCSDDLNGVTISAAVTSCDIDAYDLTWTIDGTADAPIEDIPCTSDISRRFSLAHSGTTCEPEVITLSYVATCATDGSQVSTASFDVTVYPDPSTMSAYWSITDGDCNGPTVSIDAGCEPYITITQNGGPTFPVTSGTGTVNYDINYSLGPCCTDPITAFFIVQAPDLGTGSPSQEFSDFGGSRIEAADDFVVPAGGITITGADIFGGFGAGAVNPSVTEVNVYVYNDAGGAPGTTILCTNTYTPPSPTDASYFIDYTTPCTLPAGTYWISAVVTMNFDGANQWFWIHSSSANGSPALIQDPDGLTGGNITTTWDANGNTNDVSFVLYTENSLDCTATDMADYNCQNTDTCPADPSISVDATELCDGETATITGMFGTAGIGLDGSFTITESTGTITVTDGTPFTVSNTTCAPITYTFNATATCDDNSNIPSTGGAMSVSITVYPTDISAFVTANNGTCSTSVTVDPSCGGNVSVAPSTSQTANPGEIGTHTYTVSWTGGGSCIPNDLTLTADYDCPANNSCPADPSISVSATELCDGETATITGMFGTAGIGLDGSFTITESTGTITVTDGTPFTVSNTTCAPITYTFNATATCDDNSNIPSTGGAMSVSITVYPTDISAFVTANNGTCSTSVTVDPSCGGNVSVAPSTSQTANPGEIGTHTYTVSWTGGGSCIFNDLTLTADYDCPANPDPCPTSSTIDITGTEDQCADATTVPPASAVPSDAMILASLDNSSSSDISINWSADPTVAPTHSGSCAIEEFDYTLTVSCTGGATLNLGTYTIFVYPSDISAFVSIEDEFDGTEPSGEDCTTSVRIDPSCAGNVVVSPAATQEANPGDGAGTHTYTFTWASGTPCTVAPVTLTAAYNCVNGSCEVPTVMTSDIDGTIGGVTPNHYNITSFELAGDAPYTYDWTRSGFVRYRITTLANGNVLVTIIYADNATWSVDILDVNLCETSISSTNNAGDPIVISDFDITPAGSLLGTNGEIDITVIGGTAPYTYSWSGPRGFNSPNEDVTNLRYGWYTVEVCDVNGDCTYGWYWVAPVSSSAAGGFIRGKTSIELGTTAINSYPNPTAIATTIEFSVAEETTASINVFDLSGKKVAELFNGVAPANTIQTATLDATDLASGIYFVQLTTATGEVKYNKLVVAK